jgi:hypothetical protein
MEGSPANPIYVILFFVARCVVPLLIMLGVSALLRKLGYIHEAPSRYPNQNNETAGNHHQ